MKELYEYQENETLLLVVGDIRVDIHHLKTCWTQLKDNPATRETEWEHNYRATAQCPNTLENFVAIKTALYKKYGRSHWFNITFIESE